MVVSNYAHRVISVEPHPINYKLLKINKIANNVEGMLTLNAAIVGTKTDRTKLCESTHSGGSSIMIESPSKCYRIQTKHLNELIESYTGNDKVLLKMNIEGAEFDIFKSVDPNLLRSVERIVMEVHLRYGSLNIIVNKLKSAGFSVKYFYPPLTAKDARPPYRATEHGRSEASTIRYLFHSETR